MPDRKRPETDIWTTPPQETRQDTRVNTQNSVGKSYPDPVRLKSSHGVNKGASRPPSHTSSGSQPFRYSRERYRFASGTLVIFRLLGSYSRRLRVRRATAYRLTASEMGPAFRKLPGDCA